MPLPQLVTNERAGRVNFSHGQNASLRTTHSGSRTIGDRIVFTYTELGNWDAALEWIKRGYRNRPSRMRRALMDQLFDRHGFATLPRYGRLLRLAGLEEML